MYTHIHKINNANCKDLNEAHFGVYLRGISGEV